MSMSGRRLIPSPLDFRRSLAGLGRKNVSKATGLGITFAKDRPFGTKPLKCSISASPAKSSSGSKFVRYVDEVAEYEQGDINNFAGNRIGLSAAQNRSGGCPDRRDLIIGLAFSTAAISTQPRWLT